MNNPLTPQEYRRLVADLEACQRLIRVLIDEEPAIRNVQLRAIESDERTTRELARLLNHLQQWVERFDTRT